MKCCLCNKEAAVKDTIGNVEYHYCIDCYLRFLEAKEAVKDLAEKEEINELIEQVKEEKDQYYKAVLQAILKRGRHSKKKLISDMKSVIEAIDERR